MDLARPGHHLRGFNDRKFKVRAGRALERVEIVAGPFPLDADQVRRCSAFGAAGSHDGIGLRYQYRCHARSLSICT